MTDVTFVLLIRVFVQSPKTVRRALHSEVTTTRSRMGTDQINLVGLHSLRQGHLNTLGLSFRVGKDKATHGVHRVAPSSPDFGIGLRITESLKRVQASSLGDNDPIAINVKGRDALAGSSWVARAFWLLKLAKIPKV